MPGWDHGLDASASNLTTLKQSYTHAAATRPKCASACGGLSALTEESYKKAYAAFLFLLHLRTRDMTKPFLEVSLTQQMRGRNLSQWAFNDRVMLAVLSTDFLKKQIGKGRDADFFRCLANLLEAGCGVTLKAYICRLFMEMKASREADTKKDDDSSANLIVVPAMLSLLRTGGSFLATYASAALVNLSSGNQAVKMLLMGQGMAKLAVQNMQAKEDDLSYYTLMLMVNLTKEPHNRSVIASAGLIPILYDIITSSYAQVRPTGKKAQGMSTAALGSIAKERLLTQACIVIGQFCNDDRFREQFIASCLHLPFSDCRKSTGCRRRLPYWKPCGATSNPGGRAL